MPAYILVQARITDPAKFAPYAKRAAELVAEAGGRYLVLGGAPQQLEGAASDFKLVISEWRDKEAALAFWHSPEYAQAKAMREGTGQFDVKLLEAWEPTT